MKVSVLLILWLTSASQALLNIVHIIVDDLRPQLGAYGVGGQHSPNIDKLASIGITFDRAYTQIAVCGPSRNSFLSGRRPDTSRSWNFINYFRQDHPDWTSLPGFFKKAGYNSFGSGKTYHPFLPPHWDGNMSWSKASLPYENPCWFYGISCVPCAGRDGVVKKPECSDHGFGPGNVSTCWCEVEAVEDVLTVDHALHLLDIAGQAYKSNSQGFYLAVGLHKPHLPWQAAPEHFARFPLDNITLASHKTAPSGMPNLAFASNDSPNPWTPVRDAGARMARRGYYAATSGVDEQVGRVVQALRDQGLMNCTAILLHGDHGWQLGEHGEWRKNTNFELGTRVPFIIAPPSSWLPLQRRGKRAQGLAELVDVMPTLAALAGIDPASILSPTETPLEGQSLVPLLLEDGASVKNYSFSQYPRRVRNPAEAWSDNGIDHVDRTNFTHMGYSIRSVEWRYTEWRHWDNISLTADWTQDGLVGYELYPHSLPIFPTDFDSSENVNLLGNHSVAIPTLVYANITSPLHNALKLQFNKAHDHLVG